MLFTVSRRALFPGLMASAVLLAGATACSRPDRSESGVDNTAAVTQDTTSTAPAAADTSTTTTAGTESGTAMGDTAPAQVQPDAPRAATTPGEARPQERSLQGDTAGDTSAAGYRAMERDTGGAAEDTSAAADTAGVPQSDSARVTEDTSETSVNTIDTATVEMAGAAEPADTISSPAAEDTSSAELAVEIDTAVTEAQVSDTAVSGYAEMARDTTTTADQIDTTDADVSADADLAAGAADTVDNEGRIRPPEDSTEILGQVTTDTSVTVAAADTVESEHIRPPEDSTELAGNVTGETADEQEVDTNEEIAAEDRETVATSETATVEVGADEVGAAAVGGTVTGAEAAALVTRQGVSCSVLDPETSDEVRWDMSSTPVTLNPCGLGSMNLSKVWTER